MKQYWQKLSTKIDSLTLRERVIIFAMAAVAIVAAANVLLLDPLFARQKELSAQVQAGRVQVLQVQSQIQEMVKAQKDPDAATRERLKVVKQQHGQMQTILLDMQKGLVTPDKMTALLGDIVRQDGRLRLVSLKTLPSTSLTEDVEAKAGTDKTPVNMTVLNKEVAPGVSAGGVYKHGVEITLQGGYLDMVNYMASLETMPWQLFWGKAKLNVEEYPRATLTLTLFTLSLDKKWLNL
jgi:MSHA biogenesis protein MshJ